MLLKVHKKSAKVTLKEELRKGNHLYVVNLDLSQFISCHCGHFYSCLDSFSITLLFTEFTEFINILVFHIQGFSVAQQIEKRPRRCSCVDPESDDLDSCLGLYCFISPVFKNHK